MKKYLILFFIITACSSLKHEQSDKEAYINEFKLNYFKSCLENGFDNPEIISLNKIDKSGMTEPILGIYTYKMIDSLTVVSVSKMLRKEGEVAEGAEGKHVYTECLNAYNSKWLDSIAKAEYKKYIKPKNNLKKTG